MRMKLHVVLAVLALTWTCWSVDAFKLTSSKKPQKQKTIQQKNKNNQLFNTAKDKWNNQLGQPLNLECDEKNGEGIFQVRSEFHAKEKDRQYLWQCHSVATEPMTDCTWSNEINEFQGSLLFMCQSNFVINGISSTYNPKKQDRKWKIKCCRANNHFTRACKISESINKFGKPFFYTSKDECSDPGVMTGLASEINRESLKDREWKILQCSYANQKSCKYKCNSIRSRGNKKRKHKRKSRKQTVHKEESQPESKLKHEQQQHFGRGISTHRHHHHSRSSLSEFKHHNHHHKSHFQRDNHRTRHEKHFAHKMRHPHKENEDIDSKYERKPHKHRHHPRAHYHRHNHVPVADTVESKPHESKQQSNQKPPPSPISNTMVAPSPGLPRPVIPNIRSNSRAYFPTPTENNPWLTTPGLLRPWSVPIQRQPRLLSTPTATNYMESSPPITPSQPVNGPQIAPVGPNSNPTNLFQHPQYMAPFYSALDSRISSPYYSYNRFLGMPQTPFQLLRGITLHPQNAEFSYPKQTYDFFHPTYPPLISLPQQDITSPNWLNAFYRISSLQKSLPNEDRKILQEALLTIAAHHLHSHVPTMSLKSPVNPHIPIEIHNNNDAYSSLKRILGEQNLERPLNVHIHLPESYNKESMHPGGTNFRNQHTADQLPIKNTEMHTRHTSHQEMRPTGKTLDQKRLVHKINQLLSRLPKNLNVQSDIPRIKTDQRIKIRDHTTIERPNYSKSVVSLIPAEAPGAPKKDDKTEYIEALNRLYSRNTEPLSS